MPRITMYQFPYAALWTGIMLRQGYSIIEYLLERWSNICNNAFWEHFNMGGKMYEIEKVTLDNSVGPAYEAY